MAGHRIIALSGLALSATLIVASQAQAHAGGNGNSVTGSAKNQFLVGIGDAALQVSAHSDAAGGNPNGFIHAVGDPDGTGPVEPFQIQGHVTCLRVDGNRASVKYRFESAEGSAAAFDGGGVQVFIEDNGEPRAGQPTDRSAFDAPQPAGLFQLDESRCDDPDTRLTYDGEESGNYLVLDRTP